MSAKASERWILLLIAALCSLPLIIVMAGSTHMRFIYEDYCFAHPSANYSAQILSVPQRVIHAYNNHSGTFMSALFHSLIPPSNFVGLAALLSLSLWYAISFLTIRDLLRTAAHRNLWAGIISTVVVSGSVTSTYNINHFLYWYIALLPYILPIVAITMNVGLIVNAKKGSSAWLIIFVLGVLAGATSHTATVFQVVLFFLLLIVFWRRANRNAALAGFLGSIVSLVVVLIAPGNAVRASAYEPDLLFALSNSIYLLGQPLVFSLSKAPLILLSSVLLAAIYAYYYGESLVRLPLFLIYAPLAALVAAGGAFFPGLYVIGGLPPGWTWIIPIWATLCGAVAFGYLCGLAFRKKLLPLRYLPRRAQIAALILALGFALNGAPIALQAVQRQAAYAAAWDERDAYLRTLSGSTETVRARSFHGAFDLEDLTDDPNYWTNACIANYYNLSAIVADDQPPFVP